MTKSALITGITGQDGSYLAELLLERRVFDWEPKITVKEFVKMMVESDIERLKRR